MADLTDLRAAACVLPEAVEGDDGGWSVRGKAFAWERPLRPKDLAELGLPEQIRTVVCLRCGREDRDVLIASRPEAYFATSHFANFPAVLVWLDELDPEELREVVTEAWALQAPKRLAKAYLSGPLA